MSPAGTVTPAARRGETRPPRRVLLLSESEGMAAVLGRLLERDDRLTWLSSLREMAEWDEPAGVDAVVVDLSRRGRHATLEHLRRRYRGPLVVIVERGADTSDLPPDEARKLLVRPFVADDLRAALGLLPLEQRRRIGFRPPAAAGALAVAAATAPAALAGKAEALLAPPVGSREAADLFEPADGGPPAAALDIDIKVAARPAPPRPGGWPAGTQHVGSGRRRVELLLTEFAHAWRTRRWVRVAGFSTVCLLAFTIAFALAAQGRCGPGCDDLGTGVAPPPTYPLDVPDAPTTIRRAPTSTAPPNPAPGNGDFKGASGSNTSTTARASTTTQPAQGGGGTTRPPTTRPTTTNTTGPTTTVGPTTTTIKLGLTIRLAL
jgi:hypothetical protein